MIEELNEVRLVGKIASDVELKKSASGKYWLTFSVETTTNGFHRYNMIMAFGDTAENLSKNARKGKWIKVLGNVGRSKNKKTGNYETNITLYKFEVLKDEEEEQPKVVEKPRPNKKDEDVMPF